MNWYYAEAGQQAGPVSDEELGPLLQRGTITPTTLVWHSGLPGWQPFAQASATLPASLRATMGAGGGSAGPGETLCSQCGRVYPADEVVEVSGYSVCAGCKPLLLQKLQQGASNIGVYGAAGVRFAGFWIRFGAAILDGLIMLPFSLLLNFVFQSSIQSAMRPNPFDTHAGPNLAALAGAFAVYYAVIFSLQGLYNGICLSRFGGMPGMLICGLRVVRPDGQRVSFWRGVGRFFASILSGVLIGFGYLFIVFDEQKRALHDYIVDTRVIYK